MWGAPQQLFLALPECVCAAAADDDVDYDYIDVPLSCMLSF
jgi:hypothetical protein